MKKIIVRALLFLLPLLMCTTAGAKNIKYAALTFDDGPSGIITMELLEGLQERNIRATFFLCCYRIEDYPQVVRQMAKDGHEIGIHGCSHEYFTRLSRAQLLQELEHTAQYIQREAGQEPNLIRPPGGLYNSEVVKLAKEEGLSMILWSLDPEDWDTKKRQHAADHIVQNLKPGDIVLLHDLSGDNVRAALEAADQLTARGWQFVTVSRLAEIAGSTLEAGGIYRSFP